MNFISVKKVEGKAEEGRGGRSRHSGRLSSINGLKLTPSRTLSTDQKGALGGGW